MRVRGRRRGVERNGRKGEEDEDDEGDEELRIIYRHYATLYFV